MSYFEVFAHFARRKYIDELCRRVYTFCTKKKYIATGVVLTSLYRLHEENTESDEQFRRVCTDCTKKI